MSRRRCGVMVYQSWYPRFVHTSRSNCWKLGSGFSEKWNSDRGIRFSTRSVVSGSSLGISLSWRLSYYYSDRI